MIGRMSSFFLVLGGLLWVVTAAEAHCGGQYAGPVIPDPTYFFSSSCNVAGGARAQVRNEVCSIAEKSLPFYWDKLNWVSGSGGIKPGECLYVTEQTKDVNIVDVPASSLRFYGPVNRSETTNVYLSGNAGSEEEIQRSLETRSRKEGGTARPFHLSISFAKRGVNSVRIRATVRGGEPKFYLYLPRNIKTPDELSRYISPDYSNKIRDFVAFNDAQDRLKVSKDDPVIATYSERYNLRNRARVSMAGDGASIEFDARTDLAEAIAAINICAADNEGLFSCL